MDVMTAPNSLTAPVSTDNPGFPAILSLLISHQLSVGPGQGAHARVRDAPIKKIQLNYGLLPKGGGGDPRQSKSF